MEFYFQYRKFGFPRMLLKWLIAVIHSFTFLSTQAQDASKYVLLPSSSALIPVNEKMQCSVQGYSPDGTSHEGGKNQFFKKDNDNHMVQTDEPANETYGTHILLGSCADQPQKTRDGFQINFSSSRDTTYTDDMGVTHHKMNREKYQVTMSRRKAARGQTSDNYHKMQSYDGIIKPLPGWNSKNIS